jgi:phosphoglycerate dehydrogenase-like enzyme
MLSALPNTQYLRWARDSVGAEELALLPDLAVVINVGRAEVVDEDAMWAALQQPVDGGGCSRLAYGSDVWWAEGLPAAAVKRGATVQSNAPLSAAPSPVAEEGVPQEAATEAQSGSGSGSGPAPEPPATLDVFDSVERKYGSKYPMHELDNVVMTPHYGGGRGLPGVEPARANALGELIRTIVAEKQWPSGANLEMGY